MVRQAGLWSAVGFLSGGEPKCVLHLPQEKSCHRTQGSSQTITRGGSQKARVSFDGMEICGL